MTFRWRLFLSFLLYGIVIVALSYFFLFRAFEKDLHTTLLEKAQHYAQELNDELQGYYIGNSKQILHVLSESEYFREHYKDQDFSALNMYLKDITKISRHVMQLRFLSPSGKEILRINQSQNGKLIHVATAQEMQDKSQRYYVDEIKKLNHGEFWISPLDLNVEHGSIEKPYVPVIRLGTPFYLDGKLSGMFIVNVFMEDFLEKLAKSSLYDIYLIDTQGHVLSEPARRVCFNNILQQEHKHSFEFLQHLQEINKHEVYTAENFVALHVKFNTQDDLRLIVVPKAYYISGRSQQLYEGLFFFILLSLVASLILAYFLSLIPSRLKERVDGLYQQLKTEAEDRELLLSLFDKSDSVLFKWNNDEGWSVAYVSQSVYRLTGYSKEEFESGAVKFSDCIHEDDLQRVVSEVTAAVTKKTTYFTHEPYRLITKNGEEKWILDHTIVVRNSSDEIEYYIGYLSDITELKEKEIELKLLARTDQLTKIYNRLYLDEVLYSQYYRFNRYNEACSAILMDIDYFKSVNDEYGHLAGDKVLQEFAMILKNSVRADDVVGRWGGEEFLIILPHTEIENAAVLATKLLNIIREHEFPHVGHKTASFGVTQLKKGQTVERWIDATDEALYEAKNSGRNCVVVYE